MADEFNTEGMLDMYLYENGQLLEQLEKTTLDHKDVERFDDATINEFFRIMHTIKGSSGIMMFDDITKVAHKMEDIFYYLRESHPENVPQSDLVEHILKVTDFIASEFEKIQEGYEPDGEASGIISQLENLLKEIKEGIKKSGEELPPEKEYVAPKQFYIAPVASAESKFYRIDLFFQEDTDMVNIRAYTASYQLKDIAEDLMYYPEDIITNEETCKEILKSGFQMLLQTKSNVDEITKLLDASGISDIRIEEIDMDAYMRGFEAPAPQVIIDLDASVEEIETRKGQQEGKEKEELRPGDYVIQTQTIGKKKQLAKNNKDKGKQQSFISVDVSKVDALMDLIGEIVIAESVVLQNQDLKIAGLNLTNFQKAAAQLTKFTSELQDVIMEMRMMPLTATFQKMNRIVFDVSRSLGKDVELRLIGDKTEVDKNMIEHISDPLMHLIRNSVDHGIEMPNERIDAGKPERGMITLEAKNEGGKVLIIVKDDGKGMDSAKLFKKAKANGLVGDKTQADFTEKQIFQFITYPGFSTKEEVTEFSGRGVGMDVVVKNIQQIGGNLEIESKKGLGTTMTIKIPLTLAIIEGILMEVGNSFFVMETGCIKEFLNLRESNMLTEPDGEEYVMVRNVCYPLIRLNKRYEIDNGKMDVEDGIIVLVEHDGQKVCIFVDHLIGEQEIVVKPIPSYIKKVRGISGCTQLGDGNIALIIDVGDLCMSSALPGI